MPSLLLGMDLLFPEGAILRLNRNRFGCRPTVSFHIPAPWLPLWAMGFLVCWCRFLAFSRIKVFFKSTIKVYSLRLTVYSFNLWLSECFFRLICSDVLRTLFDVCWKKGVLFRTNTEQRKGKAIR